MRIFKNLKLSVSFRTVFDLFSQFRQRMAAFVMVIFRALICEILNDRNQCSKCNRRMIAIDERNYLLICWTLWLIYDPYMVWPIWTTSSICFRILRKMNIYEKIRNVLILTLQCTEHMLLVLVSNNLLEVASHIIILWTRLLPWKGKWLRSTIDCSLSSIIYARGLFCCRLSTLW